MLFKDKLRKLIKEFEGDRSQNRHAELLGVDPSSMTRWLKGSGKPTPAQFIALRDYFGVSLDYLMDDSVEEAQEHEGPAAGMDPDDTFLLKVARIVGGPEEAARRLIVGNQPVHAPATLLGRPSEPPQRPGLPEERKANG